MPDTNFNILTGLNVGNVTANAAANSVATSGNITAGNLASTGRTSTVTFSVSGNSNLGSVSNITITGGSANQLLSTNGSGVLSFVNVNTLVGTINSAVANQITYYTAANAIGGSSNLTWNGANLLTVTGNVSASNLNTSGSLAVTGNASVGNILATNANLTAATVSGNLSTGNISATTVTGNISAVSGIFSGNVTFGNINAVSGILGVSGNITGGNFITTGFLSVSGNANVGNLGSPGNITASYFFGNGSQLTGITVAAGSTIVNGSSNVVVANGGNVTTSVAGVPNVLTITSTGANVVGTFNATGNANVGNIGATRAVVTNLAVNSIRANVVEWGSLVSVFGQPAYKINELTDVLFRADQRFTVTNGSSEWFDGNYDSTAGLPVNSTTVININVANQSGVPAAGITYPQGKIYVSFYFTSNMYTSISLRTRNNGVWYTTSAPVDVSTSSSFKVLEFTPNGNNYLTDIELTVVTDATNQVSITAINYYCDRWTTELEWPYFSKYLSTNRYSGTFIMGSNNLGLTNSSSDHASNRLLTWSSTTVYTGAKDVAIGRSGNGLIEINNGNSGTFRDLQVRAINPSSGNLGVGTTSPATNLEISSTNTIARITGISSSIPQLQLNSAGVTIWSLRNNQNGSSEFTLYQDTTERVRVSSGGNVGIGNSAPVHTLRVEGTISSLGNANVGNLGAAAGVFTGAISGSTTLNITGNASVGNLSATNITGTITTAAQPNITSLGTLTSLNVTGNANVGNLGAARGVFTNIAGTLETASQTNITSVGTLSSLTVSGNLTVDTTTLFVDSANNRVGIGTVTPSTGLHFYESGNPTFRIEGTNVPIIRLLGVGGAGTIAQQTDNTVRIGALANSATTQLVLAANGNIGVNTTAPAYTLHVQPVTANTSGVNNIFRVGTESTTPGCVSRISMFVSSDPVNDTNGGKIFIDAIRTVNMDLAISLNDSAGAAPVERFRIAGSGNVGIGNATPTHTLRVEGTVSATGNANVGNLGTSGLITATGNVSGGNLITSGLLSVTGNANVGNIGATAGVFTGAITGSTTLNITGNANVGNIGATNANVTSITATGACNFATSSGNVGIGTTSPVYKLEVNGSFAATTKSFVIDHPTRSGMKLRYGSLEGPENGVYVRGRGEGSVIDLPEYWSKLVDPGSVTVNITPIGPNQNISVVFCDNCKVVLSGVIADYFFTVFAERMDVEDLEVEF